MMKRTYWVLEMAARVAEVLDEIVRTLDLIRKAGKLTRDDRGRWALRPA